MTRTACRTLLPAILILLASSQAARAERFTDTVRESYAVGPEAAIQLSNTNGSVSVRATAGTTVELVAEKQVDSHSESRAREVLDEIEIVVRETDGGLEIETRTPRSASGFLDWLTGSARNASVRYELRVPADARLDLDTVNGNLSTDGGAGGQRLRSTNGRIVVEAARGEVDARTVNGSIDVEVAAAGRAVDLRLDSTNGGIALALPDDLQARLEARTVNGSVRSDLPVTISGKLGRNRISGDLNGGGEGRIELTTTNGGIRIRSAD